MSRIVTSSSRKKNSKVHLLIGFSVLFVVGAICHIFRSRGVDTFQVPAAKPTEDSLVKSLAKPKAKIDSEVSENEANEIQSVSKTKIVSGHTGENIENEGSETFSSPKTPEELGLPIVDLEAKKKQRRAFDTNTERIIAGIANTKRGFAPPPLLNFPMGENVMEILNKEIVIYEDDDDKIAQAKENCAQLKAEMKQYIADGGTPENFLSWYHNELSKDYNTWKDSQMYIVQLMKEGMVTEAEEYLEKANEELTKAGIRNVTIPENLRKLGEKKLKELQEAAR